MKEMKEGDNYRFPNITNNYDVKEILFDFIRANELRSNVLDEGTIYEHIETLLYGIKGATEIPPLYNIMEMNRLPTDIKKKYPAKYTKLDPESFKVKILWEHRYGNSYEIYHPKYPGFSWNMRFVDIAVLCCEEDNYSLIAREMGGQKIFIKPREPEFYIAEKEGLNYPILTIVGALRSFIIAPIIKDSEENE